MNRRLANQAKTPCYNFLVHAAIHKILFCPEDRVKNLMAQVEVKDLADPCAELDRRLIHLQARSVLGEGTAVAARRALAQSKEE